MTFRLEIHISCCILSVTFTIFLINCWTIFSTFVETFNRDINSIYCCFMFSFGLPTRKMVEQNFFGWVKGIYHIEIAINLIVCLFSHIFFVCVNDLERYKTENTSSGMKTVEKTFNLHKIKWVCVCKTKTNSVYSVAIGYFKQKARKNAFFQIYLSNICKKKNRRKNHRKSVSRGQRKNCFA